MLKYSWRQADCHINNLYNYIFWTLVLKGGMSRNAAEKKLAGTLSDQKNEMLFNEYGINYAHTDAIGRKGSVIKRSWKVDPEKQKKFNEMREKEPDKKLAPPRAKQCIEITHEDIIGQAFWNSLGETVNLKE